jgi:hypothetical protein
MIYQSIQEMAQLLNADASAIIFNRSDSEKTEPWNLVIRVTSGLLQIEAEASGKEFGETLAELKQKIIQTILEIQSQNESPQERSRRVDIMANESFRYILH